MSFFFRARPPGPRTLFLKARPVEGRVHSGGHRGDIELPADKPGGLGGGGLRIPEDFLVTEVEDLETGIPRQEPSGLCQVSVEDLPHPFLAGIQRSWILPQIANVPRLPTQRQHLLLGSQHLVEGTDDEDDPVVDRGREMLQEVGDDLDGLSSGPGDPSHVPGLEGSNPLQLEIPPGIAFVGASGSVSNKLEAAGCQHLHHHRCSGPGEAGHDHHRGPEADASPDSGKGADHVYEDKPRIGRGARRTVPGLADPFLNSARAVLGVVVLLAVFPEPAAGYVGPGPGFVLVTSFLAVFASAFFSFLALVTYPFRAAWLFLRRLGRPKPRVRRVIIVGFDGQDPQITDRMMEEGRLPNFRRLAAEGSYRSLATTYPSVSPVAWSSFSTGTHPAKHGIYDFLDRDRKSYMPVLSSSRIGGVEKKLKLGRWRIPLEKPKLRLLRGSRPFWSILGENWIWSTILRVPVTFPPDRFRGAQLSAMCVPDLLGSQGTFTLFTTRTSSQGFKEGGRRVALRREGGGVHGGPDPGRAKRPTGGNPGPEETARLFAELEGPPNELKEGSPSLSLPLVLETKGDGQVRLTLGKETHGLKVGKLSEWIPLVFPAAPGLRVRGLCRAMVTEVGEKTSLYVSPIHLDPEHPAMPISHPAYYGPYLARKIGPYATLGLAEDTWAMNEGVIDGGTFLEQTYAIDAEREAMLSSALDTVRRGAVVCVFDATDRIQHMFWRSMEEGGGAIENLYEHNDAVLGRVLGRLKSDDLLMVLSDHGFAPFHRGVNLNAWLKEAGYLALKEGADGSSEWLRDVDWSKTRAYALGLTGIFLNIRGREGEGIVDPAEEANELRKEIAGRLADLRDEERDEVAIREAFDPAELASGPYLERAPDLIVGYNRGYRASWDGATGVVAGPVFTDNTKAWSGDHCIDPRLVPGVLFSTHHVSAETPSLVDIAPTTLWLFGLEPPPHMDGKVVFQEGDLGGSGRPAAGKGKGGNS